jgi:hypothetical protein
MKERCIQLIVIGNLGEKKDESLDICALTGRVCSLVSGRDCDNYEAEEE